MNGKRTAFAAMVVVGMAALGAPTTARAADAAVDGITFAEAPGTIYAPVREVAEGLGWSVGWDAESRTVFLDGKAFHAEGQKRLWDGTLIAPATGFEAAGARVRYSAEEDAAIVSAGDASVTVADAPKKAVVNLSEQELRAYQGDRVVLRSRVSSGERGHRTPTGTWDAGPYKARMHYSSLYEDAPMPYSVQVVGDIFIHGFSYAPGWPESHGCIRLPLDVDGRNPARFFYRWVGVGTPVTVEGRWQG